MREDLNKEKNKIHKRKKTHKVYAAIVLALGIVIISLAILILFYVQRIEIKGNQYCSDTEIAEAIQNDRFSINTLYVLAKYKLGKGEIPCVLETMDISLKNPWTLSVTVEEKEIAGCYEKGKERIYFDKEGLVVLKGYAVIEGVPCVEGVNFKNIKLYKKMTCENKAVFEEIYQVNHELKDNELTADSIRYINDRIYVYIGKTCVSLGTEITPEKIAQIKPILQKLEKKKGTLHLENYSSGNETITFAIGEFPKEN